MFLLLLAFNSKCVYKDALLELALAKRLLLTLSQLHYPCQGHGGSAAYPGNWARDGNPPWMRCRSMAENGSLLLRD